MLKQEPNRLVRQHLPKAPQKWLRISFNANFITEPVDLLKRLNVPLRQERASADDQDMIADGLHVRQQMAGE